MRTILELSGFRASFATEGQSIKVAHATRILISPRPVLAQIGPFHENAR
jgi:hypothetical protein